MAPRSPWKLNNLCVFTNMSSLLLSLYNTQDHLTLEYTQSGSFRSAGCWGCSENLSSPYSTASSLGAALPVPFRPAVCRGCPEIFISPYSTSSAFFCTCLPCRGSILMSAYCNSCPPASSAEEHKHVFNPGRCQVAYKLQENFDQKQGDFLLQSLNLTCFSWRKTYVTDRHLILFWTKPPKMQNTNQCNYLFKWVYMRK